MAYCKFLSQPLRSLALVLDSGHHDEIYHYGLLRASLKHWTIQLDQMVK